MENDIVQAKNGNLCQREIPTQTNVNLKFILVKMSFQTFHSFTKVSSRLMKSMYTDTDDYAKALALVEAKLPFLKVGTIADRRTNRHMPGCKILKTRLATLCVSTMQWYSWISL